MSKPSMIHLDLEKARLDPGAVFETPEDLLEHPELDRPQKIELLRRWEYDAKELEVAEEEGMVDGESSLLDRVLRALHALKANVDVEHSPPTKQGGV